MESNNTVDGLPHELTEEDLKSMSRRVKELVPQTDPTQDDLNKLKGTLDDVFLAAEHPALVQSHRVAAWNTLCATIDQCSDSKIQLVSNILWDHNIVERAFNLFLDKSQTARPKSSKQLLQTLSRTLRGAWDHCDITELISKHLADAILSDNDHKRAKACLQALAHFLRKESLNTADILYSINAIPNGTLGLDTPIAIQDLLSVLFRWGGRVDFGSVVSQVVSTILDKADQNISLNQEELHCSQGRLQQPPLWSTPLEHAIENDDVVLDEFKSHVFPVLFRRNLLDYTSFLYRHGLDRLVSSSTDPTATDQGSQNANEELLHVALQTGKELGLLCEVDSAAVSESLSTIFIPARRIGRLLSRSTRSARLTGLSLLIVSPAATRPFLHRAFTMLKRHLSHFFADTDANFRGEVFSLMQKLIDRLRAITAVLARQTVPRTNPTEDPCLKGVASLDEHKEFLKWLLRFLRWELRPTASYQTHISALKALSLVVRSGLDSAVQSEHLSKSATGETKWPFHLSIMTLMLRRLLLGLLMNPFDDVRQTTASILSLYATSHGSQNQAIVRREVSETITNAESVMLLTGRADHADGVAHLYSLLYRHSVHDPSFQGPNLSSRQAVLVHLVESLENMLDVAKKNLGAAVNKYPLHGLLTSLRYILLQKDCDLLVAAIPDRLQACLYAVWETVRPVLCNDAPEGYLYEGNLERPEFLTKDLLSYCWRALKESSLLIDVNVSKGILARGAMLSLSTLCFSQLAELRHRGAFSTVAQTWVTCCIRCRTLKSQNDQFSLQTWYDQMLYILKNETTINTRRSAGLPSLLCGLLIADSSREMFSQAYRDLTTIARQPVDNTSVGKASLSQVHALNCVKDILKNTRLGEQSERYLPQSLRLAADSLRSEAWAVRNCGLMLFRAVIDRLIGTSDANLDDEDSSTKRFSTKQHPELLDIILDLLIVPDAESAIKSSNNEGVFPALQLLQWTQLPEHKRSEAAKAVCALTRSRSWHVRDKAARVYASIESEYGGTMIQQLLEVRADGLNALHGTLLCVRYIIRRLKIPRPSTQKRVEVSKSRLRSDAVAPSPRIAEVCSSAFASAIHIYEDTSCAIIKVACVDIMNNILWCERGVNSGAAYLEIEHHPTKYSDSSLDIFEKLRDSLANQDMTAAHPSLRSALARALALELLMKGGLGKTYINDAVSIILSLARVDADACSSIFAIMRKSQLLGATASTSATAILLHVSSDILSIDFHIKLKCEVQQFLLECANCSRQAINSELLARACNSPGVPLDGSCNQRYADQWLQLQAVAFELQLDGREGGLKEHEHRLQYWIDSCTLAIKDQGLYSREAAALAISRMNLLWHYLSKKNSPQSCELSIAVYDLLNDDDEEIRELAAQAASRIVTCSNRRGVRIPLQPAEARQQLLKFMVKRWSRDPRFAKEAFSRAFGISPSQYLGLAEQLSAYTAPDTALFAEEKPNLYIDDAQEVKVWSHVLLNMSAATLPKHLVRDLGQWVTDGLDTLSRELESEESVLGWNAKPEVFTLGLRSVRGAEVLLVASEQGVLLSVRPSTVRLRLMQFDRAVRTYQANPLWAEEVEQVLNRAILSKIRRTYMLLDVIATNLIGS